ncbi:MAG: GDP-L-fucose synthase family protein [bacterium]
MKRFEENSFLITGGSGFLGSFVVNKLKERGCQKLFVARSQEFDLREKGDIVKLLSKVHPDIIIHCAAVVGGIQANCNAPAKFFYDNLIMGIQLIELSRRFEVEKLVLIGTVCSYPKYIPVPFKEEKFWDGYPDKTNAPYGLAKKALLVQSQAYHKQFGFNSIYLIPSNLYGPGDNFDTESSHVIPALIKKCFDAIREKKDEIVVWGDKNVTRDFLYVKDCAEAVVLATERYNKIEPVNIGTGNEISIQELIDLIVKYTGFKGNVTWDSSKPSGQPRRWLDVGKASREFSFIAKTSLEEGLQKTIEWYGQNNVNSR